MRGVLAGVTHLPIQVPGPDLLDVVPETKTWEHLGTKQQSVHRGPDPDMVSTFRSLTISEEPGRTASTFAKPLEPIPLGTLKPHTIAVSYRSGGVITSFLSSYRQMFSSILPIATHVLNTIPPLF